MYGIGTIKLTWIDPNDYKRLNSKMFAKNQLQEAIKQGEVLGRFMLFELEKNRDHSYSWKLLPYGQSNDFVRSMKFRDSLLAKIAVGGLLLFSVYGIATYLRKNKLKLNVKN